MHIKHLLIVSLILVTGLVSGCHPHDEEHVHEVPVTENAITYDLASVHGMVPGEWYHFDLDGYDDFGDYWYGSVSKTGLDARWVNGVWATPVMTQLELTHGPSGGTIQRSTTLYLDNFGQEVKLLLDNGVACYPQLTNDIPSYAEAGDYGDLGIMLCSDGSELHGIWDLYSNLDESADFVTLSTSWYGGDAESSTEVTQTLNPDGLIIGYATSLYLPEYGVSLWLESI